jgi:hypothetical protein
MGGPPYLLSNGYLEERQPEHDAALHLYLVSRLRLKTYHHIAYILLFMHTLLSGYAVA